MYINAMQGFDLIHSGLQNGLGLLGGMREDQEMYRSISATHQAYSALVGRYNELHATSVDVCSRLARALRQARQERDSLQAEVDRLRRMR